MLFIVMFLIFNKHKLIATDNCAINTTSDDTTDIHIIGFFPCTDRNDTSEDASAIPMACDGIDRMPIMQLALEEINKRCDLLPGYRLVVDYANSNVS